MIVFVWMWYFGLSYALNETLREEEEDWETLDYWNEPEFDPPVIYPDYVPDYGPNYGVPDYGVPDYGVPDYEGPDYVDPIIPDPGVSEPPNAIENLPAMAGAVLFLSQALGVGVFACWQRHKRASAAGMGLESGPFIPPDRRLVTTL